jgi:hypothetical protein
VCAAEETAQRTHSQREGGNGLKKLIYLMIVALVVMVVFLPSGFAQTKQGKMEKTVKMESTQPLPSSGGISLSDPALLVPAAAMLLGVGVLGYGVLRRR